MKDVLFVIACIVRISAADKNDDTILNLSTETVKELMKDADSVPVELTLDTLHDIEEIVAHGGNNGEISSEIDNPEPIDHYILKVRLQVKDPDENDALEKLNDDYRNNSSEDVDKKVEEFDNDDDDDEELKSASYGQELYSTEIEVPMGFQSKVYVNDNASPNSAEPLVLDLKARTGQSSAEDELAQFTNNGNYDLPTSEYFAQQLPEFQNPSYLRSAYQHFADYPKLLKPSKLDFMENQGLSNLNSREMMNIYSHQPVYPPTTMKSFPFPPVYDFRKTKPLQMLFRSKKSTAVPSYVHQNNIRYFYNIPY